MIKIILLFIMFLTIVKADRFNAYLLIDDCFCNYENSNGEVKKSTLTRTIINTDYLKIFNKNKFVVSVNYTGFNKSSYNNKYKIPIGDFHVLNATNFYYSRKLLNDFIFTIGIINYKTPRFNNNTIYNSINGIGIYGLIDFELESCLITYKKKNFDITTGVISKGKYVDTTYVLNTNNHTDLTSKLLKAFNGSNGYVTIINYKQNDKLSYSFNYYNYKEFIYNIKSKTLNLVGFETKYDRTSTVGDMFYGILSISKTNGDSSGFKKIDKPNKISNKYYGKYKTNGYNLLLGYNYTIDEFYGKHSMMLGCEYKYSSDGYDNIAIGAPFSLNNGGAVGSTIKLYGIYTVNRNFLLNIMYGKYINGTNKVTMLHGIPLTKPIDSNTHGAVKSDVFNMGLIYKF